MYVCMYVCIEREREEHFCEHFCSAGSTTQRGPPTVPEEETDLRLGRGQGTVDRDALASSPSTGRCLSKLNRRISSKSSSFPRQKEVPEWNLPRNPQL